MKMEEAKMAVKINGINHCAISVADIEETITVVFRRIWIYRSQSI